MHIDHRCDWCQNKVEPHHASTVVDHLLLHQERINGNPKTCEEHYRAYCRYIKEQVEIGKS